MFSLRYKGEDISRICQTVSGHLMGLLFAALPRAVFDHNHAM
jgi:hypothetical protein